MPNVVTPVTVEELDSIALASAERGREGRFTYLSPFLNDLEVGGMIELDENDLGNWKDEAPYIVSSCDNGVRLTSEQKKVMQGLLAAVKRELRKIHGDDADCVSRYYFDSDGNPAYGVKRTA